MTESSIGATNLHITFIYTNKKDKKLLNFLIYNLPLPHLPLTGAEQLLLIIINLLVCIYCHKLVCLSVFI